MFHFDVQGAVAKSSHAGIPWLRYPYRQLGGRVHFWPFDDWAAPGVGRDGHRTHGSPTCGATEIPRSHAGILGRACAVTGVAVPEVLRASHTKPWAECEADAERLDVFNGFLLTANLDALFDRFLISFDERGRLVPSPSLAETDLKRLGIVPGLELRWVAPEHQSDLSFHRARFLLSVNQIADCQGFVSAKQ